MSLPAMAHAWKAAPTRSAQADEKRIMPGDGAIRRGRPSALEEPRGRGTRLAVCALQIRMRGRRGSEVVTQADFPRERAIQFQIADTKIDAVEIHPAAARIDFVILVDIVDQAE